MCIHLLHVYSRFYQSSSENCISIITSTLSLLVTMVTSSILNCIKDLIHAYSYAYQLVWHVDLLRCAQVFPDNGYYGNSASNMSHICVLENMLGLVCKYPFSGMSPCSRIVVHTFFHLVILSYI